MTREEVAELAKEKIVKSKKLLLELPTSYGKTFISLDTAFYYINKKRIKDYKILILVGEIAHINNWKAEFNKWGFPLDNVELACYASMKNYIEDKFTVIILDEVHHATSLIRASILHKLKADRFIMASATMDKEKIEFLGTKFTKDMYRIRVSLNTAFNNNTLPEPTVILVPVELDSLKKDQLYIARKSGIPLELDISDKNQYLYDPKYSKFSLRFRCTALEYYIMLTQEIDRLDKQYRSKRTFALKNKLLQKGTERKRWLGEYKTEVLSSLLKELKDKRYICFCSSIGQAEAINKYNSIHSKKSNPLDLLNEFNLGNINSILVVKMLREGLNLVDTQYGIITQLDSRQLSAVQMVGRVLRHKEPIIYVLYVKNTRDEDYLNSTIRKFIDPKYIKEYGKP